MVVYFAPGIRWCYYLGADLHSALPFTHRECARERSDRQQLTQAPGEGAAAVAIAFTEQEGQLLA